VYKFVNESRRIGKCNPYAVLIIVHSKPCKANFILSGLTGTLEIRKLRNSIVLQDVTAWVMYGWLNLKEEINCRFIHILKK